MGNHNRRLHTCPTCNQHIMETMTQLSWECIAIKPLIRKLQDWLGPSFRIRTKNELHKFLQQKDRPAIWGSTVQSLVAYLLWSWWKARNNIIFEGRTLNLDLIWHHVILQVEEQIQLCMLRSSWKPRVEPTGKHQVTPPVLNTRQ